MSGGSGLVLHTLERESLYWELSLAFWENFRPVTKAVGGCFLGAYQGIDTFFSLSSTSDWIHWEENTLEAFTYWPALRGRVQTARAIRKCSSFNSTCGIVVLDKGRWATLDQKCKPSVFRTAAPSPCLFCETLLCSSCLWSSWFSGLMGTSEHCWYSLLDKPCVLELVLEFLWSCESFYQKGVVPK